MALNYVKIAGWFEALGEAQGVDTLATEKQLSWEDILKESQVLRMVTRGETMATMRLQQAKLERLTQTSMGELVEEISGELPSLTSIEAPKKRKSAAKRRSVPRQELPDLSPINTSQNLFT